MAKLRRNIPNFGNYPPKASARERRIITLAQKINGLMRRHADRLEAIDAYDVARILFRLPVNEYEDAER
jgi:cytochrome c